MDLDIFNNRERSGYEEIKSYGPSWWPEYREMDAVYRFAGWTLDLMALWLEKVIGNQFPAYMDEKTIVTMEHILDIIPRETDTLEERRKEVAACYPDSGKASRSTIQRIIKSYSGCDSEIWWGGNDGMTLEIKIINRDDVSYSMQRTIELASRKMPAYIPLSISSLFAAFELQEEFIHRLYLRLPISPWAFLLDGTHLLDGVAVLDGIYPTVFRPVSRFILSEPSESWSTALRSCFSMRPEESLKITDVHRLSAIWWDGTHLLDGVAVLDGSTTLSDSLPPVIQKENWRVDTDGREDINFIWYVPADAVLLNSSTVLLDGTINLNSGREEL